MISREMALLKKARVNDQPRPDLANLLGSEPLARAMRQLAALFCDHDFSKHQIAKLPALGARVAVDGTLYSLHGHSLQVTDGRLSFGFLLEDPLNPTDLLLELYAHFDTHASFKLCQFECPAQDPRGSTRIVLALLDAVSHLHPIDGERKAAALAKLSNTLCKHSSSFTLHFTQRGLYAMDDGAYLGSLPWHAPTTLKESVHV